MPLKVLTTVLRSADDLDQKHLIHLSHSHQGVREGTKIENTWKGEEKRGRNNEKGRERIGEITRKMARERDGGKKQEIRIERDKREIKEKRKRVVHPKMYPKGF